MSTPEESKKKLMNAIVELVRTTGYRQATTKKIAAKAGMNEASIFRLFGSKKQLFLEAVYENTISPKDIDEEKIYDKTDSKSRLEMLISNCFELGVRQMSIYRFLMLRIDNDENIEAYKKHVFQRIQDIIDYIKDFLKTEYSDYKDQSVTDLISEMFFSMVLIESLYIATQTDEAVILKRKKKFVQKHTNYIDGLLTS